MCGRFRSAPAGRAAGAAARSCCRWSPTTPAPRGRPRCARRCSSTACGWPGRSVRPTAATSWPVGGPTPSSRARPSRATTRWSRRRCGCTRRRRKLERPRFLTQPPVAPWADVDVFIAADRAAWEERPLHSLPPGARVSPGSADGQRSIELINQLAALRRPTQEPQPAGARRPLRHSAFRGHRGAGHHRHHAVLAAGVVGGRRGGRRRAVMGRGRRRADRAVERRCRSGRRCCCAR